MNAHKVIEMLREMKAAKIMEADHADFLSDKVYNSVKFEFDFGNIPEYSENEADEIFSKLRLPFPLCYFDIPGIGSLLAFEVDGVSQFIMIHPFFRTQGKLATFPVNVLLAIDKSSNSIVSLNKNKSMQDDIEKELLRDGALLLTGIPSLVVRGLSVLNCSNVICVDNHPSSALNKKRAKHGKVPMFSFKTLHLDVGKTKVKSIGKSLSNRAGPRLHLRRGHIRRIDENRTTWVQSCMVGDKSIGVSLKDYRITYKERDDI